MLMLLLLFENIPADHEMEIFIGPGKVCESDSGNLLL